MGKLKPTANHWIDWFDKLVAYGGKSHGITAITDVLKRAEYVVIYLSLNGSVELAELINDKQQKAGYKACDRDLKAYNPLYIKYRQELIANEKR